MTEPDSTVGLSADGAMYAVDLEQRITRWNAAAEALLGPASDALGRRCYEVYSIDPARNPLCRPDCRVVTAARRGVAHPDFDIRLLGPPCGAGARVSILLLDAASGTEIVHLVRAHATDGAAEPARYVSTDATAAAARLADDDASGRASILTDRQAQVLRRLAEGQSPQRIANELGVSTVTVRNHVQASMERLGAHSRLEAVMAAAGAGLI